MGRLVVVSNRIAPPDDKKPVPVAWRSGIRCPQSRGWTLVWLEREISNDEKTA